MKAVQFPAATPVAVSPCPTLPASSNASGGTEAFAQVMDQALGSPASESQADADPGVDPKSEASVADVVQKEPAGAAHWLAALLAPMATPSTPTAAAVITAEGTDTLAALSIGSESTAQGETAAPGDPVACTFNSTSTPLEPAKPTATQSNPAAEKLLRDDSSPSDSAAAKSGDASAENSSLASKLAATALKGTPNAETRANAHPPGQPGGAIAVSGLKPQPEASSEPLPTQFPEDSTAAEFSGTNPAGQKLPLEAQVERPAQAHPGRDTALPSKPIIPAGSVPPIVHGTSGAKYVSPNQKAENMNEFTGSSEQNLPGKATLDAPGMAKSRTAPPFTTLNSDEKDVAELNAPEHGTRTGQITSTSVAVPVSQRTLERTEDLMALHGLRLRDSGLDSMRVVIKPDANLHLALNVQIRDNTVEITAQLQRGDHEALSRHWPELQQQLEQRGIRVAPLTQSEASTGSASSQNNHPFSHDSRRHQNEERQTHSGAFAEFALESALIPKTGARTGVPRGWESWA